MKMLQQSIKGVSRENKLTLWTETHHLNEVHSFSPTLVPLHSQFKLLGMRVGFTRVLLILCCVYLLAS